MNKLKYDKFRKYKGTKVFPKVAYRLDQSVTFHDLFFAISVDDSVQAFESATSHEIAYTFFLYTESLYLIVDVEKEGVITGGVI